MYYILNLDHHGDYQGVYYRFNTEKEAKTYLDTILDTIRIGRVGYNTILDNKKVFRNIIFESSARDVEYNESLGYHSEEDDGVFNADLDKILNFVSKYKYIIADDIYDDLFD